MHMPAAKPKLPSKVGQFQSYITEPAHSFSQGSECHLNAHCIYQAELQDKVSTVPGHAYGVATGLSPHLQECGQGHGKNSHLIERKLA